MDEARIAFLVPRSHVKRTKTALEEHKFLDRKLKIIEEKDDDGAFGEVPRMRIVTNILKTSETGSDSESDTENDEKAKIFSNLGLLDLLNDIQITTRYLSTPDDPISSPKNPLLKALATALDDLQPILSSLNLSTVDLITTFPTTYSIYKPMLLLPAHTLSSNPWTALLSTYPPSSSHLTSLWQTLASSVGTTHIALNSGIPPSKSTTQEENILRAPLNITPIYGDFGPTPAEKMKSEPTEKDFEEAFWVSTTQNAITQVWAPMYTMFSRGNIREKTRVLNLPSVASAVSEGKAVEGISGEEMGCTAVDLYAGIGYFSFCYKEAGVKHVLCWELNPWSIEGLRRGAEMNGWTTKILPSWRSLKELDGEKIGELEKVDFLVFRESNEEAVAGVYTLLQMQGDSKSIMPPVRHVNCGFLPSSSLSWETAVRVLDSELAGWIHAHENVGVDDIESRKDEVVRDMQRYIDEWEAQRGSCGGYRKRVVCEHVERVKTYAPGVLHVVFDVKVDGQRDAEDITLL